MFNKTKQNYKRTSEKAEESIKARPRKIWKGKQLQKLDVPQLRSGKTKNAELTAYSNS